MNAEELRLEAHKNRKANWKLWGPYLSERAWGTVREDYSPDGDVWNYFIHEQSHFRTYRWNEDGLAGISDRNQFLCFALALWNEKDEILKERLFGLSGPEGNHGEDVKEYYFYLDNTPTHSYMKMLYKYPQEAFPYRKLVEENRKRGYGDPEYELLDTGIFENSSYFDVFVEYAKAGERDILIRITLENRSKTREARCHLLPTLWFRNTWVWGYANGPMDDAPGKPVIHLNEREDGCSCLEAFHPTLGRYFLYADESTQWIFTENETNTQAAFGHANSQPYVKDAFHRYLIDHDANAVNPRRYGTKAAALYRLALAPGEKKTYNLRLTYEEAGSPFENFNAVFSQRIMEADEFYNQIIRGNLSDEEKLIQRQAFAGLLWSKQLYYYDIEQWLKGDPGQPKPPEIRKQGRNSGWEHIVNFDVFSMPDKWEYPWYASWDLAFHCIPFVMIDPEFAKRQLTLMTREWYMHPNGELPAYEWEFSDVNPPVIAWSAWRVYKIDAKQQKRPDNEFLKGIFTKLLLNFTWWVNRKDREGKNVFQGGFLGLDNISLFDRSKPLPMGGYIDQSDGTAWMGFYCVTMMKIALELSGQDSYFQDIATKFFEHFLRIANAMNNCGGLGVALWNEEDGFYYDVLHLPNHRVIPIKVRSLVGLLPLFAIETLEPEAMKMTPLFERRVEWFVRMKPHEASTMASVFKPGEGARRLMSIVNRERLVKVLKYMFDENEFLSEYGIRSLSKVHRNKPYSLEIDEYTYRISYEPGESQSGLFGGNSNWRGPVWFPINHLIIESLQKYHHYYGNELQVEFPTGSGRLMNLWDISLELSRRLSKLFLKDANGKRPIFGKQDIFNQDPHWKDLILFYEYFHGETGAGLGASHQTGWTALVAKHLQQAGGR